MFTTAVSLIDPSHIHYVLVTNLFWVHTLRAPPRASLYKNAINSTVLMCKIHIDCLSLRKCYVPKDHDCTCQFGLWNTVCIWRLVQGKAQLCSCLQLIHWNLSIFMQENLKCIICVYHKGVLSEASDGIPVHTLTLSYLVMISARSSAINVSMSFFMSKSR